MRRRDVVLALAGTMACGPPSRGHPATRPLRRFEAVIEGDSLFVRR
jgi:hypothetical protein